jgi:exodeoxyribonuclease V alpha subunit
MHLTVRMAWHDSDWNGAVCCDPKANTYCVGTHSLLSGRIEKKRNLDVETKNAAKPACSLASRTSRKEHQGRHRGCSR